MSARTMWLLVGSLSVGCVENKVEPVEEPDTADPQTEPDTDTAPDTGDEEEEDGCPVLSIDAASLSFVDTLLGVEETAAITLTNDCTGEAALSLSLSLAKGTNVTFSAEPEDVVLEPGASHSFTVAFTATSYSEQSGSVLVASSDPAAEQTEIPLLGQASADQDGDGYDAIDVGGDDCDDFDASHNVECLDGPCAKADIFVPGDASTIQLAIDSASDGSIICVASGTWAENLDFGGKEIWLVSEEGSGKTIIDGTSSGRCLTLDSGEGENTLLMGFTLTGGYADSGAGIYMEGSAVTLSDVRVEGNESSSSGAGIWLDGATASLSEVVITGNEATGSSAGIYLGGGAQVTVEDVEITDNISHGWAGAGIYIADSKSTLEGSQLLIRGNENLSSSDTGGSAGLYAGGGTIDLTNVIITGNANAGRGGGFNFNNAVTMTLTNAVIVGNSSLNGGAAFIRDGSATVELINVVIADNQASSQVDGIWDYGGATVDLEHCDIYNNAFSGVSWSNTPSNLSVDPGFTAYSSSTAPDTWDLHLSKSSDLIDAGDASITDTDGSTSDIGAYGGPGGGW